MNNIYIAIDGDSIGKIIERYILTSALNELKNFSRDMQEDVFLIGEYIKKNGGNVYMQGGDNILGSIDKSALVSIIKFIESINHNRQYHFSIGLGDSPTYSYLSLKYAKLTQKTPIIYSSDSEFKTYCITDPD